MDKLGIMQGMTQDKQSLIDANEQLASKITLLFSDVFCFKVKCVLLCSSAVAN